VREVYSDGNGNPTTVPHPAVRAFAFLGVTAVLVAAACGGGQTPPPVLPGEAVPGLEARVEL